MSEENETSTRSPNDPPEAGRPAITNNGELGGDQPQPLPNRQDNLTPPNPAEPITIEPGTTLAPTNPGEQSADPLPAMTEPANAPLMLPPNVIPTANPSASPTSAEATDLPEEILPIRMVLELVVLIVLVMVGLRAFVAEPYMVPTGSMAETLLGYHLHAECPNCGHSIQVGLDRDSIGPNSVPCPNCNQPDVALNTSPKQSGDRLLVQKWSFDFLPPRRWEPVVFWHPEKPREAWVKRCAGLPGESVQIIGGDIFVDGAIARKTIDQYLYVAIPVYHHGPQRQAPERRFIASDDTRVQIEPSSSRLVLAANETPLQVEYRHLIPDRFGAGSREAPVRDSLCYNQTYSEWDALAVSDLSVHLRITPTQPVNELQLQVGITPYEGVDLRVQIDHAKGTCSLFNQGQLVKESALPASIAAGITSYEMIVGHVDQQLLVRLTPKGMLARSVDIVIPIPASEFKNVTSWVPKSRPVWLEVQHGSLTVDEFSIKRDIHYTSRVGGNGIASPYKLADDEYFLLGDNTNNSDDSRTWSRAGVPTHLLVGRPSIVHLPSRTSRIKIGSRVFEISAPVFNRIRSVR